MPGPDSRAAKLRSGRDSPIARKFRAERGLPQEELAFECGLHRTYVSGVERGVRNPTVVILEKIAEVLKPRRGCWSSERGLIIGELRARSNPSQPKIRSSFPSRTASQ